MTNVTECSGRGWSIRIDEGGLRLVSNGLERAFPAREIGSLNLRRGFLGFGPSYLSNQQADFSIRLRGLKQRQHRVLRNQLAYLELVPILQWREEFDAFMEGALADQRWITHERREDFKAGRPNHVAFGRLQARHFPEKTRKASESLALDIDDTADRANEEILRREFASRQVFLETIEKSPLTREQAEAVLRYDNRVLLVAAAGSGKTSVMVARAAYAVDKGLARAENVLLLAFNRSAAKELEERVEERFTAAGIPSAGIRASTFHSLGLSLIGEAAGAKPRVAPWVADNGDIDRILDIMDVLRDRSTEYRYQWDLYRLIYARAPIHSPAEGTPDGYDRERSVTGFETLDGKVVRSFGEKMVADWLFLNGVRYEYEKPYAHPTASARHSQYHPDFYYPDIDVWHEHWALDWRGKPPVEFTGYADGMRWKKGIHRKHDTELIETTWHEIVHGASFTHLQTELESRGIELDWNPDRVQESPKVMTHRAMASLMRTFLTHIKSNSIDQVAVEDRLNGSLERLDGTRTRLFLYLFWPIYDEWNDALRKGGYVDFEDMLVLAAGHLERNETDPGYDLVLVDEFQDASNARVRLVAGLVNKPHRHLLAVGDDWQSINRFAGADITAMTDFEARFGPCQELKMTRTFRFPQELADVSSDFVAKNPRQIDKVVKSHQQGGDGQSAAVEIVLTPPSKDAVLEQLRAIADGLADDEQNADAGASVFVLGRYRHDRDLVPRPVPDELDVTFSTVHSSKGLEADYVIVPNMSVGTYGFPSEIEDDPVLDLAMTAPDEFPYAEERRLFYVALTRARRRVILIADKYRPSSFIVELIAACEQGGSIHIRDEHGEPIRTCEKCGKGVMVKRSGPFGQFYGCSRFPACDGKSKTVDGPLTTEETKPHVSHGPRCEMCGTGTMVARSGRNGPFFGCSNYPDCKNTRNL